MHIEVGKPGKIAPALQIASAIILLFAGIYLGSFLSGAGRTEESTARLESEAALAQETATAAHRNSTGANSVADEKDAGSFSPGELLNRFAQCFAIISPEEQSLEFLHLLKEMRAADAPAVLDLLKREQAQGVFSEPEWHAFWARWGSLDGPAALDYNLSIPDSRWNGDDIWLTMRGWTETNPDAAAAWLRAHPNARHQDNAFLGYVEGLASKDLNSATKMALSSIPRGDAMMSRVTEELADQAVRQGKLAGLEVWFDRLPADSDPGSAKSVAAGHVWSMMEKSNFDAAVEWVRKHADDPWRNDQIIGQVAGQLSRDDPQAAVSWLQDVKASPSDGSYPGLDKVVENWAKKDPAGIESWLNQPNGGALQQQGMAKYAAYLARTNKEAAKVWLQRATPGSPNP